MREKEREREWEIRRESGRPPDEEKQRERIRVL